MGNRPVEIFLRTPMSCGFMDILYFFVLSDAVKVVMTALPPGLAWIFIQASAVRMM